MGDDITQMMNTQTILSDNNQIQLLLNLIIEQTASNQNAYEDRIHLIDALHLAIFNSLNSKEDADINTRKNGVIISLNKMKALNQKQNPQDYMNLNVEVHTNMDLLNKLVLKIAHNILNTPFRGNIKW